MTTVSLLSKQDEESWSDFVLAHPSSTVYHTLEWRDVSKILNHRPYYLIAKDCTGSVKGVFPLFYLSGMRGKRLVSVPLRDRGGPLGTDYQTVSALLEAAQKLAIEKKCRYLAIKTTNGLPPTVKQENLIEVAHYIATVLSLDSGVERMWESLDSKKVKWAVRKAEKKGVKVKWGKTRSDIHAFYKIFLRTRSRLGVPAYPVRLFEEIWKQMGKQGTASFLLAFWENEIIAGLVLFNFKNRVIEAYAASDARYLNLCANDLLVWKALEWAAKNGYHYFDFGASSPYQKGLRDFKLKWGGYEQKLPFYFYLNGLHQVSIFDSNAPHYRIFRRFWKGIPISCTRILGPFLSRQMD